MPSPYLSDLRRRLSEARDMLQAELVLKPVDHTNTAIYREQISQLREEEHRQSILEGEITLEYCHK